MTIAQVLRQLRQASAVTDQATAMVSAATAQVEQAQALIVESTQGSADRSAARQRPRLASSYPRPPRR